MPAVSAAAAPNCGLEVPSFERHTFDAGLHLIMASMPPMDALQLMEARRFLAAFSPPSVPALNEAPRSRRRARVQRRDPS